VEGGRKGSYLHEIADCSCIYPLPTPFDDSIGRRQRRYRMGNFLYLWFAAFRFILASLSSYTKTWKIQRHYADWWLQWCKTQHGFEQHWVEIVETTLEIILSSFGGEPSCHTY
jgi:hypothetical protein